MAHHVKTAISMEAPLFEEIDQLARKKHVSRSKVLSMAAAEYVERERNREEFARLNEVYAGGPEEEDRVLLRFARRQMKQILEAES